MTVPNPLKMPRPFRIYGHTFSFFTRKLAGHATVQFASGQSVDIAATDYLKDARATLLARYARLRNDRLDAVLDKAGILSFYRDHLNQAGPLPDPTELPRPRHNRPYPTNKPRPQLT